MDNLSDDAKKVMKAIKNVFDEGHYVIEGGGAICNFSDDSHLPILVLAKNINGIWIDWFRCETMKEAKEKVRELKTGCLEIGKPFPKTKIIYA